MWAVGATLANVRCAVCMTVAVLPSEPSVDVADTVSANERLSALVMVRPARSPGARLQTPPPWFVPCDRVTPLGTPLTRRASDSEPSVSVNADEMVHGA